MSKTEKAYIKVEAVNIYASVFDTEQLSVIRGSSFLLKAAIDAIKESFIKEITAISTGASSGLFEVDTDVVSLPSISNKIKQLLNSDDFNYFTFVVVHTVDSDFNRAKEKLVALLRFQQMQSLSLAPDVIEQGKRYKPCEIQGSRAASLQRTLNNENGTITVSDSVWFRFLYGKDKRSNFYQKEINDKKTHDENTQALKFTNDINQLSNCSDYKYLSGKMAVIYFDGNAFSTIQRKQVNSIAEQKEFDAVIQGYRKEFLTRLIEQMQNKTSSCYFDNSLIDETTIRLETLMWGGDEMLFVVPAWLGFDFVQFFYQQSKEWRFKDEPLTHAGGIVFCNRKTPISKIQLIAQSLADSIKEKEYGRSANFFDYLVLESIDYPVEDCIDGVFDAIYGNGASLQRYPLNADHLWFSEHKHNFKQMLSQIPRGQIYKIVNELINTGDSESSLKRLKLLMGKSEFNALNDILLKVFSSSANSANKEKEKQTLWCWVHLVELWDYIEAEQK